MRYLTIFEALLACLLLLLPVTELRLNYNYMRRRTRERERELEENDVVLCGYVWRDFKLERTGWPYEWEDDDDEFELSENYPLCRVFSTETFPSEKPWPMHILNKLIRFVSELMYVHQSIACWREEHEAEEEEDFLMHEK